jgi:uncharacterized protein YgiM (DUF1202 family)
MLRRLPILLVLVLLLASAALGQRIATIEDPDGYTNVRDGPGTAHNVVGKVYVGERMVVYPDKTAWWRVILPSQEFVNQNASGGRGVSAGGFIAASRVKLTNLVASNLALVNDPDGYANLRNGPGTNHDVVGRVARGEFVISLDLVHAVEWSEVVTKDGRRGFMHSSRLSPLELHLPADP